eukprot:9593535-Alexandrium_andersonii.AAC.1
MCIRDRVPAPVAELLGPVDAALALPLRNLVDLALAPAAAVELAIRPAIADSAAPHQVRVHHALLLLAPA